MNSLLFVEIGYSLVTVICTALIAFGLGFFVKSAVIFKQKRRIFKLEDEMLANHSRILSLEKRIAEGRVADIRKEVNGVHKDVDYKAAKSERELRAS